MSKVKQIIYKVLGNQKTISPIYDPYLYGDNCDSFCGGSLENENVLIITNLSEVNRNIFFTAMEREKADFSLRELDYIKQINDDNGGIVPFAHIINVFELNKCSEEEDVYEVYTMLQKEADYLVNKNGIKTLCTAIICKNNIVIRSIESLIKGLGAALGNHEIICSGITASHETNIKDVFNSLIYMSGKYGYLLAGEVLDMTERNNG